MIMEAKTKARLNSISVEEYPQDFYNNVSKISSTDIILFLKSPREFFYSKMQNATNAKNIYLESAVLYYVNNKYVVAPKLDRRTKQGKEDYANFLSKHINHTILSEDEFANIKGMSLSLKLNPLFISYLNKGEVEMSNYNTCKDTNIEIKTRPSIKTFEDPSTIIDIQCCIDSSEKKFVSDFFNFNYAIRSSFNLDFSQSNKIIYALIEKNPPYQLSFYSLPKEVILQGRKEYKMALSLLKWSYENNFWCDHSEFSILKKSYNSGKLKTALKQIQTATLVNEINIKTIYEANR